MPAILPKPTATTCIARLSLDATHAVEITINGVGMTYDKSGAIISGDIYDISIGNMKVSGPFLTLLSTDKASGLNMTAAELSKVFGTTLWNDPKLIVEAFGKFLHLNEGISESHFSEKDSTTSGSNFSDELTGSRFADKMNGNGGDDDMHGGTGNDLLQGGDGDDQMWGDMGNDTLYDVAGNNGLYGGFGDDKLLSANGSNRLEGGTGRDILAAFGGNSTLMGGAGADKFVFAAIDGGAVKIADFTKDDMLVNIDMGAEEAMKDFMAHAHQEGRHVVYDEGDLHLVLRYVKLDALTLHNFADAESVMGSGLF